MTNNNAIYSIHVSLSLPGSVTERKDVIVNVTYLCVVCI